METFQAQTFVNLRLHILSPRLPERFLIFYISLNTGLFLPKIEKLLNNWSVLLLRVRISRWIISLYQTWFLFWKFDGLFFQHHTTFVTIANASCSEAEEFNSLYMAAYTTYDIGVSLSTGRIIRIFILNRSPHILRNINRW